MSCHGSGDNNLKQNKVKKPFKEKINLKALTSSTSADVVTLEKSHSLAD
jgi:hypothetical protein